MLVSKTSAAIHSQRRLTLDGQKQQTFNRHGVKELCSTKIGKTKTHHYGYSSNVPLENNCIQVHQ